MKKIRSSSLRDNASAGFLDLFLSRGADFVRSNRELLFQLAGTKDLDAVVIAANEFCLKQRLFVHGRSVFELIERVEIDDGVARLESRVVKSALGQTADEGHLAAFETETDTAAGARLLALVAFAA